MKRSFFTLLACLPLLAGLSPLPLAAQSSDTKTLVRESLRDIQRLGLRQREALYAEMYNLLFMEGSGSPYEGHGSEDVSIKKRGKKRTVNIPYRAVRPAACFIGSNGVLYDFFETGPHARDNDPKAREQWLEAKLTLHLAGKQRLRPHLEKQLKELEIRRAIYLLKQMPPVYRQALFAELLGLCYMKNGGNAHAVSANYELEGEHRSHKAVKAGALFMDADGHVHDFHRTYATEHPGKSYHWECVKFCYLHGHKEMFTPFQNEVDAMRKQRETEGTPPGPASPAEDEPPAPAPSHSTASPMGTPAASPMGSTTMPTAERPLPPAGDLEAQAQEAVHYINLLPERLREALLAQEGRLLFMEDGQNAYKGDLGHDEVSIRRGGKVLETVKVPFEGVKERACFIGADGNTYDFYASLSTLQQDSQALEAWGLSKLYLNRAGKEAVFRHFRTTLDAMKKHHAARAFGH